MSDQSSIYFLALIPLVWCFLSWLMAKLSGWSRLARDFSMKVDSLGVCESAWLRSGRMGVIQYHSVLTFRIYKSGLGISVAFPLRLGHPPLFVPWSELHHVTDEGVLYSHRIKASIGHPTIVRMTLPGWVKYRLPPELRADPQ